MEVTVRWRLGQSGQQWLLVVGTVSPDSRIHTLGTEEAEFPKESSVLDVGQMAGSQGRVIEEDGVARGASS